MEKKVWLEHMKYQKIYHLEEEKNTNLIFGFNRIFLGGTTLKVQGLYVQGICLLHGWCYQELNKLLSFYIEGLVNSHLSINLWHHKCIETNEYRSTHIKKKKIDLLSNALFGHNIPQCGIVKK